MGKTIHIHIHRAPTQDDQARAPDGRFGAGGIHAAPKHLLDKGKHKPGSTMAVVSRPSDPDGQYQVVFKPQRSSPLGRTKAVTVARNLSSGEHAQEVSRAYAAHHSVHSIDKPKQ